MRIALTHNLRLATEDNPNSDSSETVSAIIESLRELGHDVEVIEISESTSALVIRLAACKPDLVFNTAKTSGGPLERAFYPALFNSLKLPFIGSDAHVCTLTSDKHRTMQVALSHGIKTPRSRLVSSMHDRAIRELRFPLILNPNFTGLASKVPIDCLVETPQLLYRRLMELVNPFPEGIIVEEHIPGRDVSVVYLEGGPSIEAGTLEPVSYEYDTTQKSKCKRDVTDLGDKSTTFNRGAFALSAGVTAEQRERLVGSSREIIRLFNLCDVAQIDFRVADNGEIYFRRIDTLPAFGGISVILSAEGHTGVTSLRAVAGAIVESAAARYRLKDRAKGRRRRDKRLVVALTFNIKKSGLRRAQGDDDAEFDSPVTIRAIHEALDALGHRVVELEAGSYLPGLLAQAGVDIAFNIAEGFGGRHRESHVPALLELLNIPYTGSDPTTLSLALDKSLAKLVVSQAGCRTASFVVMSSAREAIPEQLAFPVIVKPVAEGSSKGINASSVVEKPDDLRKIAAGLIAKYRQPALVESYLPGREFTVALLGEDPPRVLQPMEVIFTNPQTKHPIYDFSTKFENQKVRFEVPADVNSDLRSALEDAATRAFAALGCRDYARIDLRLDDRGRVNFIECNPLPGIAPGFSDFCVIAEKSGLSYHDLIREMVTPCIRRWRKN
ncbi:MAG: D-alanine--D-alanine ligase [Deltaproteobacteria bacterium]|nr:D-alanine--D-alanine ligase [Deltaproteobacteria bacterium]